MSAQHNLGKLPAIFLTHASEILASTDTGLTGTEILKLTAAYAFDFDASLPHSAYPFDSPNKRTALLENLHAFSGAEQFRIIYELCDHPRFGLEPPPEIRKLKQKMISKYASEFGGLLGSEIEDVYVRETKEWLANYPKALKVFNEATVKLEQSIFERNLLDDLRLSLEILVGEILNNNKSLENQIPNVGALVRNSGGSKEFSNMFGKLVDYYTKYQNSYVKHADNVNSSEIHFIFEMTAAFMRHFIRMAQKDKSI